MTAPPNPTYTPTTATKRNQTRTPFPPPHSSSSTRANTAEQTSAAQQPH
nr:MAG TPA: hypothetical protein [Caudoviricetes sp.]